MADAIRTLSTVWDPSARQPTLRPETSTSGSILFSKTANMEKDFIIYYSKMEGEASRMIPKFRVTHLTCTYIKQNVLKEKQVTSQQAGHKEGEHSARKAEHLCTKTYKRSHHKRSCSIKMSSIIKCDFSS